MVCRGGFSKCYLFVSMPGWPSAGTAAAALLEQRRLQRVEAAAAERKQASGSKSPLMGRRGGVASFAAVDGADADAENAVRRPPH